MARITRTKKTKGQRSAWSYADIANFFAYGVVGVLRSAEIAPFAGIAQSVMWAWLFITTVSMIAVFARAWRMRADTVDEAEAGKGGGALSTMLWVLFTLMGLVCMGVAAWAFCVAIGLAPLPGH